MGETEHKVKRQLNQSQINMLVELYRFRFGTTELLATSLGKKSGAIIHPRLMTLAEQGYIARNFDSSYRQQNKHASYYLLPEALRLLQKRSPQKGLSAQAIKNSYNDKTASDEFIEGSLRIYAINNRLKAIYPSLELFTKRELTIYDYFPKPLPDAYVSLKVKSETKRYLLELYEAYKQPFVIDRRLRQLIEYYQNAAWQAKGSPFPPILCICETGSVERRIRKQINRALSRTDTDMSFYTTTLPAILDSSKEDDAIWSSTIEPEKLCSLEFLDGER